MKKGLRVFLIKHKGAVIWQNISLDREIVFSDGGKVFASLVFFRKKDAEAYLRTLGYKDFYEVVGATVDKVEGDNRKSNKILTTTK